MIVKPEQRVAIFIDTQNMYHSAKHLFGARVNFPALVETAAGDRPVIRAVAYVAKSKTGEEQAFFDALIQNGIELKIKDVQEFASGQKKADWDVGMTVDAISISSRVDVVVLVTGDGDFCPLVEFLHAHGVLCEVAAFSESTNARLREIADTFLDLSTRPEKFLIHARGRHDEKDARNDRNDDAHQKNGKKPVRPAPRRPDGDGDEPLRKIRVTY